MLTHALLVRLEALPGKEDELAEFLTDARSIVLAEPGTVAWFAVRFGPTSFGVFDAFPDDEARQAHLAGGVGQALGAQHGGALLRAARGEGRRPGRQDPGRVAGTG